jgi:hypothetical protein
VDLKRLLTLILHGSTSQNTNLNFILAAVRTLNLTYGYFKFNANFRISNPTSKLICVARKSSETTLSCTPL